MRYVVAIDQGTTSTRCILFDRDCTIVAAAQKEHEQILPRPGWVEHDAMEIWHRTQEVIEQAIRAAGARPGQIAAVGIANQRETTVLWDRTTGRPVCNAIVWQDTRTKALCDELARADSAGQDRFRDRVGLPLATYFSGPKIRWILDNVPGVREAARQGRVLFGNIDTWLIWNLTGGAERAGPDPQAAHVTDVTNASRTMLMNLATLDWDQAMLEALDVPRAMLPRIVPSSAADPRGWGTTSRHGVFGDQIPVCGDLGDQQAALVGQACFAPGESKNTYGTGCFMLLNSGERPVRSERGLLSTVAYRFGDAPAAYALEGSVAVAGALVQWLRDNLGLIHSSAEIEALARSVDDSGGVFIVPAFSGLFAPYWRSDARGVIVGLTRQTNRAHLARAALEATAFQTRDVVQAMIADSGVPLSSLRVDGGMCVNELLMQFQADVLGVEVVRPKITETTALGAAYAAGLAVGFWKDLDELRSGWREDRRWRPTMPQPQCEHLCRCWQRAVQRSFGWVQ
ncbi:glycerol kinase GlpK [Fontivita pretiosa]|uniref:glycerol kinase GlpK n=1 Tax=Fontivita pretiosa TaxID=2989684 RepID=UPI003D165ECC